MKYSSWVILLAIFLFVFDFIIWEEIVFSESDKNSKIYFLNVGQGDSELVVLPNNVKVLIDGGPDNKVLNELSQNISSYDRYIDLVILSHAQLDHFGGLIRVVKNYKIGAFIFNGRNGTSAAYKDLENEIKQNKIPVITLSQNDKINYLDNKFEILSPSKKLLEDKNLNNTVLVIKFTGNNESVLFTGDIGKNIEDDLIGSGNLKSDILKVAHHGSKYSSAQEFLDFVSPKISVIEVGKNSYGHPNPSVLNRLKEVNSRIFRTDINGTVKIELSASKLNIFSQR